MTKEKDSDLHFYRTSAGKDWRESLFHVLLLNVTAIILLLNGDHYFYLSPGKQSQNLYFLGLDLV